MRKKILGVLTVLGVMVASSFMLVGCFPSISGSAPPNCSERPPSIFQNFRQTRQQERNFQIAMLENIMNSPEFSMEIRKQAEEQLIQILEFMTFETMAEGLIFARGFANEAIVARAYERVHVLVGASYALTQEQVGKILYVLQNVCPRTTFPLDNIFISVVDF